MATSDEETEVNFISALDDAAIRQNCFQFVAQLMQGCEFDKVLSAADDLYQWVMGEYDQTIEEAAEPASVTTEEPCEPRKH